MTIASSFTDSESTTDNWHQALARAVRDPDELLDLLELPVSFREPARRAAELFPLMVPRGYVDRMQRGDPRDPLLLQVLPLGAEEQLVEGFHTDAVGDAAARRAPGLLHKYAGRALLIAAVLLASLLAITKLHRALHPPPEPPPETRRHPLEA